MSSTNAAILLFYTVHKFIYCVICVYCITICFPKLQFVRKKIRRLQTTSTVIRYILYCRKPKHCGSYLTWKIHQASLLTSFLYNDDLYCKR